MLQVQSRLQLRHVNSELLEPFIGLTYNQDDRIYFIWPGTRRCMLKDLLFDEDFTMTKQFESSFIRDLLRVRIRPLSPQPRPPFQAMQYLHESCQLTHGALNTQSCMISRYWSLKLCDYGLNNVIDEMTLADVTTAHEPIVDGRVGD